MKLKEKRHAPLVVTLHGGEINILSKRPAFKQINGKILDRTDSVVCVSKDLSAATKKMFGVKSQHIPNGVDTSRFAPVDGEKDIALLFVGMFREEKGLDILLDAMDTFKRDRPRAVIVGNGPLRP